MSAPRPAHARLTQFPVEDGCLTVGGATLTRLARRAGRTPFYVYDRALLDARMHDLRTALPAAVDIHYAVKANPMPALVQHMAGLVDGLDVASLGELRLALDTAVAPERVSFAGPGKTTEELAAAVAAGVTVNLESENELERVVDQGRAQGVRPRVAVRVNPDFELRASGMRMGGGPRPFGVDAERVPALLARIDALELDFQGFHVFAGSQNLRAEAIVETQSRTFELILRLARDAPAPVRVLNIGGGFGIPYFPGDRHLDLGPIGENLERWLPRVHEALPGSRVVLELGRYLAGEAGLYVARVVDRKISRGRVFLNTDGGLHHHLAASGNFGQVIRKNYPVVIANRMDATGRETVTVTGPLCTPLDLLAEGAELPEARVGDLVAVFQSGAYGLTASPTGFLGHPRPVEMLV